MSSPKFKFVNFPSHYFKCRSDTVSLIKGDDHNPVSIEISNLGNRSCKIIVRLLLQEPESLNHFYILCRTSDRDPTKEIEYNIRQNTKQLLLDFFGIKKPLKKDAIIFLREHFRNRAEEIYKKNSSTIVLQISLVDGVTKKVYHEVTHLLSDKKESIKIVHYSPHFLLYDDESSPIITIITENPEKDNECISLELENSSTILRVQELTNPLSIKNVFVFQLKPLDKNSEQFKARLCRNRSSKVYSNWIDFSIRHSGIELGKRKRNKDDENSPQTKIPRTISSSISENTLSDVNIDDCFSNQVSYLVDTRAANKTDLKNFFETKVLSSIARVGHDYAFGKQVTDEMKNIATKLPLVFILQDDVGDTPLHNAILQNQENRATYILDMVVTNFPENLYTKNSSNHTALILSPACGVSVEFVKTLLSHGFNLIDKDIDGNNALTIAIQYKNTKILQALVDHAVTNKSFGKNYSDVITLLKETILRKYFEGFQIIMQSQLANDYNLKGLESSSLDLDSDSEMIFDIFWKELFTSEYFDTMIPEYYLEQIEDLAQNHLSIDLLLEGENLE